LKYETEEIQKLKELKLKKLYCVLAALAALCVFFTGCGKKPEVADEKFISLHYRGTLSDGSEFDASEEGKPLEFIYGAGMMIPGFEKGIAGMHVGEEKTIHIKAEDAYGAYDETLVFPVARKEVPAGIIPEIGMQLMVQTEYGPRPIVIKDMNDTEIFLDYNMPLAGKDLTFEIKILEIRDLNAEEQLSLKAPGGEAPPPVEK
jgi:peptidylprolyl isomerase